MHLTNDKNRTFSETHVIEYLEKEGFKNIEINAVKASIEDSFIRLLSN